MPSPRLDHCDTGHVTALETIALASAPPGRPHRRKERIPPGTAALAAAAILTHGAAAVSAQPVDDPFFRYTGTAAREDIVLRISAEADGPTAVEGAREFARTLRRANLSPLTDGAQIAQPAHGRTPAPRRAAAATPRTRFTDRFTGRDSGAAR